MKRLQRDLEELAEIGRRGDTGIYRIALSDEDMQARQWLQDRLSDAGLHWEVDPAANICGKLNCVPGEPNVLTGSHLDTVPSAGHLDGALGVVAGLECLRTLSEQGFVGKRGIEVVSFTDEEGRFGGMPGSQAIAGKLTPESVYSAKDLSGVSLAEALEARGFIPLHVLRAARGRGSVHSFVELHIEQGPVLDSQGLDIGIVTGIVGLVKWKVTLTGQANHAGTTPMALRRDAFQGLAEFSLSLDSILRKHGDPNSVATIGQVSVKPGAPNVVPARAEFSLEIRDINSEALERLAAAIRQHLREIADRRRLRLDFAVLSEIAPVPCAESVMQTIVSVAHELGLRGQRMPSGAAHDAQQMASLAPTGMIFIPSKDGRSHSPAEWSSWESIEAGTNVLLNTLVSLAEAP